MTKTKISKSEARFQAKRNDITAQAILQKKLPTSKDVDWLDKDVVRYFEQFEQTWEVEERYMANISNTSGIGYGIGTFNDPFDYVNMPSRTPQWEQDLEELKRALIQRGGKVIDEKEYERMKAKMVGMQEENRKLREELAAAKKQNKALEDALALINK